MPTNGSQILTYRGHTDAVDALAWNPVWGTGMANGIRIASGSDDTTAQVWDAANGGHIFTYRGHADSVYAVAWNPVWGTGMPDGTRIASGGYDKTAQVWAAS